jgi:CRISPR-associated endonuclease Csn1
LTHVTEKAVLRYRLYEELATNGYKTLYSSTYVKKEDVLNGELFNIEHIIPKAKLFDDSFSNKTLELKSLNIEKSNATAFDFVKTNTEQKEKTLSINTKLV